MVKRGSKNISFVALVWSQPSHNVAIPYSMQCHKDFLFEHSKGKAECTLDFEVLQ